MNCLPDCNSYAVWEEAGRVPILTLEMVSHQPGGEYDENLATYARLGVLYYVIYSAFQAHEVQSFC